MALPDVLKRALHAAGLDTAAAHPGSSSAGPQPTPTFRPPILTLPSGRVLFARAVRGASLAQARGEAEGLRHMALTTDVAPRLVRWCPTSNGLEAGILSEHFDLSGGGAGAMSEEKQRELARGIAGMHRPAAEVLVLEGSATGVNDTRAEQSSDPRDGLGPVKVEDMTRFGFPVPTHCGVTEQDNTWTDDWGVFFRERRLGDMVKRIGDREVQAAWDELKERAVPLLLDNIQPPPRPVINHGDLWSGNKGIDGRTGRAVVFDPAAYYGHNEADLGVMHMFGGFTPAFFDEYHKIHPRSEPYYDERIKLYELYHHLNHTLMFGGGYKSGALRIMRDLAAWAVRVDQGGE